jgi:hypothetical protein
MLRVEQLPSPAQSSVRDGRLGPDREMDSLCILVCSLEARITLSESTKLRVEALTRQLAWRTVAESVVVERIASTLRLRLVVDSSLARVESLARSSAESLASLSGRVGLTLTQLRLQGASLDDISDTERAQAHSMERIDADLREIKSQLEDVEDAERSSIDSVRGLAREFRVFAGQRRLDSAALALLSSQEGQTQSLIHGLSDSLDGHDDRVHALESTVAELTSLLRANVCEEQRFHRENLRLLTAITADVAKGGSRGKQSVSQLGGSYRMKENAGVLIAYGFLVLVLVVLHVARRGDERLLPWDHVRQLAGLLTIVATMELAPGLGNVAMWVVITVSTLFTSEPFVLDLIAASRGCRRRSG